MFQKQLKRVVLEIAVGPLKQVNFIMLYELLPAAITKTTETECLRPQLYSPVGVEARCSELPSLG